MRQRQNSRLICVTNYSRKKFYITDPRTPFSLHFLTVKNSVSGKIHQKIWLFAKKFQMSFWSTFGWRSVKMELELEGPTPSERASVEMEGITLTLLGLGVKGILAIVELLTHFWKRLEPDKLTCAKIRVSVWKQFPGREKYGEVDIGRSGPSSMTVWSNSNNWSTPIYL